MTETTEQTIARLAKERAKTILENSDYWSGPGSAKTSAEAVTSLVALGNAPVTIAKENAAVVAVEEVPAAPTAPKRGPKLKEEPATTVTNGEPESTDV